MIYRKRACIRRSLVLHESKRLYIRLIWNFPQSPERIEEALTEPDPIRALTVLTELQRETVCAVRPEHRP